MGINIPSKCPSCDAPTAFDGEYLICTNKINCPSQIGGRIRNWIGALNLLEWGTTLIDNLVESGKVKDISDLYLLSENDISSLPRMADKSSKKVIKILHDNKEVSLEQLFGGLSIPMVGETVIGLLTSNGLDTIEKILSASMDDLLDIPGLGEAKANSLYSGIRSNAKTLQKLLQHLTIKQKTGSLLNESFCFTGEMKHKRAQLEKIVIDNGGIVKSSVGKGLSYLVSNSQSMTAKMEKASKLGTKIISEEEFLGMLKIQQSFA